MQTEEQKQRLKERRELIQKTVDEGVKKLLPCPFCGDTPILEGRRQSNQAEYNVQCDCFNERGYSYHNNIETPWFRNVELAIELWNKRKIAPQQNAEASEQQTTAAAQNAV